MAPWVDIPLATQQGEASSAYASDAELVNLQLAQMPPGSPRPFYVRHTPCLSTTGVTQAGSGAMRGICYHRDSGYFFFVRDTTVYYTFGLGAATAVPIGSMPGTSYCRMVDAGTHVVMVDGTNAAAATTAQVFAITPPAGTYSDVAYQDGYTIYLRSGTDEFYVSDLDSPTTIDALSFSTADSGPGDAVGLISNNRELIVFKEASAEIFYNSGGDFPFTRSSPGVVDVGCYNPGSIAKWDKTVYWQAPSKAIYRMTGYQPEQISDEWLTRILIGPGYTQHNTRAFAFYQDGRPYYLISGYNNPSITYVYDIMAGTWHERSSPLSTTFHYAGVANATSSDWVMAVGNTASISTGLRYRIRDDQFRDDAGSAGNTSRVMTLPPIDAGGQRMRVYELELQMEKSTVAASTVSLQWSDDGGTTYSSAVTAAADVSVARWSRLGSFRNTRIFRFTFAYNSGVAVTGVRARVEAGAA